jgi:hypothetical protein
MIIIGVDYHPEFQQMASVDRDTGEFQEKPLAHPEEAEKFYRGVRADHRGSESVSLRQAGGQLSGAGTVGRLQRQSETARAHHQAGEFDIAFLAGGSGAGDRAQCAGMAQSVRSPGAAAGTEDRQGCDGAETGGSPVLDVAPGMEL